MKKKYLSFPFCGLLAGLLCLACSVAGTSQVPTDGSTGAIDEFSCDPGWLDTSTGLCWQNPPSEESMTQPYTHNYCDALSSSTGGVEWRLPQIDELRSLVRGCPATYVAGQCEVNDSGESSLWTEECYGCQYLCGPGEGGYYWDEDLSAPTGSATKGMYWSSTGVDDKYDAWSLDFSFAHISAEGEPHNYERHVRCVREIGSSADGGMVEQVEDFCDGGCTVADQIESLAELEEGVSQADHCFGGLISIENPGFEIGLTQSLEFGWWGGFCQCDEPAPISAELASFLDEFDAHCLFGDYTQAMVGGDSGVQLVELVEIVKEHPCELGSSDDLVFSVGDIGDVTEVFSTSSDYDLLADCVTKALQGYFFPYLAGFTFCSCYGTWM